MVADLSKADEQLIPAKHGQGDLFLCDVADAVLKDLIPQMELRVVIGHLSGR
jgi:hypothetical protein